MSTQLKYPTGISTHEVTLAGPSFGDSKITPQEVKLHMTMGGTVVTTKRPTDKFTKFLFTFPNVTHTQWADLLSLINEANGRDIRMIYPSGIYVGKMLNNPVQRSAVHPERYSVTIEVVGYELCTTCLIRLMDDTGYLLTMTGDYILRIEE